MTLIMIPLYYPAGTSNDEFYLLELSDFFKHAEANFIRFYSERLSMLAECYNPPFSCPSFSFPFSFSFSLSPLPHLAPAQHLVKDEDEVY